MLRNVSIYLADEKPAVIAAMFQNIAGIYYEEEAPSVLQEWRNEESLGEAVRASLPRSLLVDRNLRDRKLTDWPAYRASKCRSVREFESSYFRIHLMALNEAALFYRAEALPRGEQDIALSVMLNPYGTDEEMGRKLLKLFDHCAKWIAEDD